MPRRILPVAAVALALSACRTPPPPPPPAPGIYCPQNPAVEAAARAEMADLQAGLARAYGETLGLTVPVSIRTVPAEGRDRWGVPYLMLVGSRVHGGVTYSGGQARMLLPVLPDGTFHRPSLRHELLHALLLPRGIRGHPEKYKDLAYRWRAPRRVDLR